MLKKITVPGGGEFVDIAWNPQDRIYQGAAIQKPSRLAFFDYIAGQSTFTTLAALTLGRWGLYLRTDCDDAGWMAAALQDGRDGPPFHPAIVAICDPNGNAGEVDCPVAAFGQNCVEVVGLESGWWVFVLVSNTSIWRGRLQQNGTWSEQTTIACAPTSQGFTDGHRDGTVLMLDAQRFAVPGMVCPSIDAGLAVGQAGEPDRMMGRDGATLFTVHTGTAFEPHVHDNLAGLWMACARTPAGPAIYLMQRPFTADVPVEPPIEPPIDPPEPPAMPTMTAAIANDITEFYRQNEPPVNNVEAQRALQGQLCQTICARHGAQYGWKRADPGRPPSADALALKQGGRLYIWDCLTDAGGENPELSDHVKAGAPAEDVTGQVFIAVEPLDFLDDTPPVEPPVEPPPSGGGGGDVVGPPQNITRDSLAVLRTFCQTYRVSSATNNPGQFPPGSAPYINDEIHENGLFIGDGLLYFMYETWAPIVMTQDGRSWEERRLEGDAALQAYMRKRCGEPS